MSKGLGSIVDQLKVKVRDARDDARAWYKMATFFRSRLDMYEDLYREMIDKQRERAKSRSVMNNPPDNWLFNVPFEWLQQHPLSFLSDDGLTQVHMVLTTPEEAAPLITIRILRSPPSDASSDVRCAGCRVSIPLTVLCDTCAAKRS